MIKIYYTDISVLSDEKHFSFYFNRVSRSRQEKIGRLRSRDEKLRSLGAGIILGAGLNEYGISEKDTEFSYSQNGKPRIPTRPDIHFSISHSGCIAAVAFSDGEIGCDIEKLGENKEHISERFFTAEERKFAYCEKGFFRVWTLKESYIKALGTGLATPLTSFGVIENGEVKKKILSPDGNTLYFGEYGGIGGYCLSWCSKDCSEALITEKKL